MENLEAVYPTVLAFEDPERSVLSTKRTVFLKPQTGTTAVGSTSSIIQFRLPNTGVMSSCYLRGKIKCGTITAGSDATNSFSVGKAVLDPFAPSASWMKRLVVKSSDGTELTNVNQYHRYCSVMNRLKNDEGWSDNQGGILEGTPYDDGEAQIAVCKVAALSGDAAAAGATNVDLNKNAFYNAKRLAGAMTTGSYREFVHEFETGILDQKKLGSSFVLPLGLMGSGMTVDIHCAAIGEVLRVAPSTAADYLTGSGLDIHPASAGDVAGYDLEDLELVCNLTFYPPELMSSLAEKVCGGLKIAYDSVRQQQNAVAQEDNTVILNTHARSVKSIIAGVRNSGDAGNIRREEGEYYKRPTAGGASVKSVQWNIGNENAPSNPVNFGPTSYKLLTESMKAIYGDEFKMGNQIGSQDYHKSHRADSAAAGGGGCGSRVGSALFGINLQSHPEMPNVLSGKSASAGSISLSCNVSFTGSSDAANHLETFVITDTVLEILADGGALVSK